MRKAMSFLILAVLVSLVASCGYRDNATLAALAEKESNGKILVSASEVKAALGSEASFVMCHPNNEVSVVTITVHLDGGWIESRIPIPDATCIYPLDEKRSR